MSTFHKQAPMLEIGVIGEVQKAKIMNVKQNTCSSIWYHGRNTDIRFRLKCVQVFRYCLLDTALIVPHWSMISYLWQDIHDGWLPTVVMTANHAVTAHHVSHIFLYVFAHANTSMLTRTKIWWLFCKVWFVFCEKDRFPIPWPRAFCRDWLFYTHTQISRITIGN